MRHSNVHPLVDRGIPSPTGKNLRFSRLRSGGFLPFLLYGAFAISAVITARGQTGSSYVFSATTQDFGGGAASSAHYSSSTSIASVSGTGATIPASLILKHGFAGQLYEVTGLTLTATNNPASVEGGRRIALAGWQLLDDTTYLSIPSMAIAWSIPNGPLSAIDANGFASGIPVSVDSLAIVQATFGFHTASLPVTVRAQGTLPVDGITADAAILRGSIDPKGQPTTVRFEYGANTAYGLSTESQDLGNGTGYVAFHHTLAGLPPGSVVHYRLVATSGGVATTYADQTFTTSVGVPALPVWGWMALFVVLPAMVSRFLLEPEPDVRRPAAISE